MSDGNEFQRSDAALIPLDPAIQLNVHTHCAAQAVMMQGVD